jgi:hypothetical protein
MLPHRAIHTPQLVVAEHEEVLLLPLNMDRAVARVRAITLHLEPLPARGIVSILLGRAEDPTLGVPIERVQI